MEFNIPEKIFDRKINDIRIGVNDIHLYSQDEINDAQAGYRYNGMTGEVIKDWIGDEYLIIGNDSCCGDPIIIKTDEDKLPVFTMFHDDWEMITKIADSFEEYVSILEEISKINLKDEANCRDLLSRINEQVKEEYYDYWEDLIWGTYEFLVDEE